MKESLVYPGEYIPSPEVEGIQRQLKMSHLGFSAKPLVNLRETNDEIRIEVAIPGIKREDVFIYTQFNILSIIVFGKGALVNAPASGQIHEFDTQRMERHIVLPGSADTDFMYGEYKNGILRFYIPKGKENDGLTGREVIVY